MEELPINEFVNFDIDMIDDYTVYRVRLARPAKLNALPDKTVDAIVDFFESVDAGDADVVTVSGEGEHFCVGADVNELGSSGDNGHAASAALVQRLIESIRRCPLPVVAGVHGRAFGTGFLLCLGVDLVVATTDASFSLPEIGLGLPVAGYASTLLPRLIGERRARNWLFTGRSVSAEEAFGAGFVSQTAELNALSDTVDSVATNLASQSVSAIAALKDSMEPVTPATDDDSVRDAERDAMRAAFEDGDAHERLSDFLDS